MVCSPSQIRSAHRSRQPYPHAKSYVSWRRTTMEICQCFAKPSSTPTSIKLLCELSKMTCWLSFFSRWSKSASPLYLLKTSFRATHGSMIRNPTQSAWCFWLTCYSCYAYLTSGSYFNSQSQCFSRNSMEVSKTWAVSCRGQSTILIHCSLVRPIRSNLMASTTSKQLQLRNKFSHNPFCKRLSDKLWTPRTKSLGQ